MLEVEEYYYAVLLDIINCPCLDPSRVLEIFYDLRNTVRIMDVKSDARIQTAKCVKHALVEILIPVSIMLHDAQLFLNEELPYLRIRVQYFVQDLYDVSSSLGRYFSTSEYSRLEPQIE